MKKKLDKVAMSPQEVSEALGVHIDLDDMRGTVLRCQEAVDEIMDRNHVKEADRELIRMHLKNHFALGWTTGQEFAEDNV